MATTGAPLPAASAASAAPSPRPVRLRVQPVEQRVVELARTRHLSPARRRPAGRGRRQQRQEGGRRIAGRAPRTGRRAGTPGEEVVEDALEARRLSRGHLVEAQRRVDDAVEHHRPHVGREEGRVGQPEQCAVGLAHVGEAAVPQRGSEPVHVARRVDRADVGEHVGARLLAPGGELLQPGEEGRLLARCRGHGVGRGARRPARRLPTRHRVAPLDPAGVEHHDVEVVEELRRECAELVVHVVDARHARAAGVDDEGADALRAGPPPGAGPPRWGSSAPSGPRSPAARRGCRTGGPHCTVTTRSV